MSWALQFGHGSQGVGASAARVDTVMGPLDGKFGLLVAERLSGASWGHSPFLVHDVRRMPIRPWVVFIPTAPTQPGTDHHAATIGVAQSAVATAVRALVEDGTIPAAIAMEAAILANVWVDPAAGPAHRDALHVNIKTAVDTALRRGVAGRPTVEDMLAGEISLPELEP